MLTYESQYNIISGIYTSFRNKRDKKQFTIKHSKEKREKMKLFFPYYKFEDWSDKDFKILSLYIVFYKSPSSLMETYTKLKEVDRTHLELFKDEIRYSRKYLKDDIKLIKTYSNKVTDGLINDLYLMNKIRWFTVYYYYLHKGVNIYEAGGRSRILKGLFRLIGKLVIYVNLKIEYKDVSALYVDEIGI